MAAFARLVQLLGAISRGLAAMLRWFRGTKLGAWIWFQLFIYMGGLIGKLLWLLGITLVANEFATPVFAGLIMGKLMGLPSAWVSFIGLTNLDKGITIILSAVAIRMLDQVRVQRRRDAWQTPL